MHHPLGKNASGHAQPIRKALRYGKYSGLTLIANLTQKGFLYYYVGDNLVKPVFSELTNFMQAEGNLYLGIRLTVDIKLPEPYSDCTKNYAIVANPSHLAKKVLDQNITYR